MRSNIFKCIHLISSYPCSEVLRFSLAVGLLDHVFGFVSLELLEECCRHWFGEYGSATVVDNQREPTLSSIPTVHKGASRHHAWNAGWGAGGSEKFRQRWMLVALVPPYLSLLFTLHFQELLTMSGGIPFWCQTSINMDVALKLHFFQIPITSSSDVWGVQNGSTCLKLHGWFVANLSPTHLTWVFFPPHCLECIGTLESKS